MSTIAILWDASQLWGLLVLQAAEAFGLPYRLVKAEEIAHGTLSDKTSLLIVPGGTARHKAAALGEQGRHALCAWIAQGGHYLGFCGGAGLGLSDNDPATPAHQAQGLGLCPWHRAEITERLQHFVSGHVRVRLNTEHPLVPEGLLTAPSLPSERLPIIPVWWPGRFAAPKHNMTGVTVLANYAASDPSAYPPDLCIADLPLASVSKAVLTQWLDLYGVSMMPDFLNGQPCVVHGTHGNGSYTLSYSHLETPDSPDANRWFAHIIRTLTGIQPVCDVLPPWHPETVPCLWDDSILLDARNGMASLISLGLHHGLLFKRASWLTGWRADVPGSGLNNLYTALCVLTSTTPTPECDRLWQQLRPSFNAAFTLFREGVEGLLPAQRLAAIAPESLPRTLFAEQRKALFGSAMQSGGLYKELMDMIETMLFLNWRDGRRA